MAVPVAISMPAAHDVAAMKGHRRVLIVAAPRADDPKLAAQRDALASWHGGDERDVTVVVIAGERVTGADDRAATLRRTYDLPADRFAVALVGKDGHVAFRSAESVLPERLTATIDAMPMRRAGLR